MSSPHEVLNVKPDASIEEIRQAYRDLVKVWHPDRFRGDARLQQKATERLKEINRAYAQLCEALGDLQAKQSAGFTPKSASSEEPPYTPPRPPSHGRASNADREETKTRSGGEVSWWKMRAWQLGCFFGDLSTGGWWLSGGRFSYWKMCKLVWMICLFVLLCAIVSGLMAQVLGETIATILFLLAAIGVGGVAVVGFVRSWVECIRDLAKRRDSKEGP